MDNRPIGFFDSGLGGLTCIPYMLSQFPGERIVYFGDTARTPYGSKAPQTIRRFAFEIADFLIETQDVKMIVIACNTVSAIATEELRQKYPNVPIIGIISPAAHTAANTCTDKNRIGVIGTKATIESEAYIKKILGLASDLKVFGQACPALVPLIEEGIIRNPIMDMTIKHYLDNFIDEKKIDTLILGCTHYPLIKDSIDRLYPGLRIIDPSKEMLQYVRDTLDSCDIHAAERLPSHIFYASDLSENFVNMIDLIFSESESPVTFIDFDLDNYLEKKEVKNGF
jgi:glutamate racemase